MERKIARIIEFYPSIEDNTEEPTITPENWQKIKEAITKNSVIQITGRIKSGKTTAIKNLIANDKESVYFILDSFEEYDLPTISMITMGLKETCKIDMIKHPCGAKAVFEMHKDMLMCEKMPENYILVVEHAERYVDSGLELLMVESPNFIKVITVSCRKLFDFCPAVRIIPNKRSKDDGGNI